MYNLESCCVRWKLSFDSDVRESYDGNDYEFYNVNRLFEVEICVVESFGDEDWGDDVVNGGFRDDNF